MRCDGIPLAGSRRYIYKRYLRRSAVHSNKKTHRSEKKAVNYLQIRILSLPLHPQSEKRRSYRYPAVTTLRSARRIGDRIAKVLGKIFGGFEKRFYLCTTFRFENKRKGLKKLRKKVLQIFGGFEKRFYLCITFRLENKRGDFRKWFFELLVNLRKSVVFICQFPLTEIETVRTLTKH